MFALILAAATVLRFVTGYGAIVVALDPVHAPKSSAAFERCALSPYGKHWTIYRTVRPGNESPKRPFQVIQGGIDEDKLPFPAIPLETTRETGLHNTAGTIAIPRDAAPNTGSPCDFFINITDNPILDAEHNKDGYGYAVFGRVVSGMDVVRKIQRLHAAGERGQYLAPKVPITRIERVTP